MVMRDKPLVWVPDLNHISIWVYHYPLRTNVFKMDWRDGATDKVSALYGEDRSSDPQYHVNIGYLALLAHV